MAGPERTPDGADGPPGRTDAAPDPGALSAALAAHAEAIARREVERAFAELGGREALTPEQRRAVEDLTDAVASGILAPPERALAGGADARTVAAAARILSVSPADGYRERDSRASSD